MYVTTTSYECSPLNAKCCYSLAFLMQATLLQAYSVWVQYIWLQLRCEGQLAYMQRQERFTVALRECQNRWDIYAGTGSYVVDLKIQMTCSNVSP